MAGKAGKEERPKRKVRNDDPSSSDFLGPWAPFQPPPQAPIIKPEGYIEAPPQDAPAAAEEATEKEKKEEKKEKKEKEKKEEKAKAEGGKPRKRGRRWEEEEGERPKELEARSILHIPQERVRDYLGRSWIQAPSELKPREHECFLPKKQVLVWSGHTRGVAAIRFFPTTGHLLLSAGLDNKICLWDTHGYLGRGLVRTYLGHSLAVKDICFTNDGRRFISASYDRTIRLWDTETGQCISTFSNNKLPYCARLHPDKQNEFLAGCKDNRIYQVRTLATTRADAALADSRCHAVGHHLGQDGPRVQRAPRSDQHRHLHRREPTVCLVVGRQGAADMGVWYPGHH